MSKPSIVRLGALMERCKKEGMTYAEIYRVAGLSLRQGKAIRGNGTDWVPEKRIAEAFHSLQSEIDRRSSCEIFRRLNVAGGSPRLLEQYAGFYFGYAYSVERPGAIRRYVLDVRPDPEGLEVLEVTDGDLTGRGYKYRGMGHLIGGVIYIFLEAASGEDELITLIFQTEPFLPPRRLFGVFAGTGKTASLGRHPACGKSVLEYLGKSEPRTTGGFVPANEISAEVSSYLADHGNFAPIANERGPDAILRGTWRP